MMRRRSLPAAALLPFRARAQECFPSRPIRLIVPFAAGGSTDAPSRLAGQIINETLGQPVVVENIGGAGGTIGTAKVVEAPADGHTLMGGTPGPVTINPHLMKSLPYDVLRDLAPVVFIGDSPGVLVVNRASRVGRQEDQADVGRHDDVAGGVPAGAVEQQGG